MTDWRNRAEAVVLLVSPDSVAADRWRRELADRRPEWAFKVATSAQQATDALIALTIDAVLLDDALTGDETASLLTLTDRRHPKCTRVVLGSTSQLSYATVLATHRYFPRFKADELCEAVETHHELQHRLADPAVLAIVHTTNILPSPPASIIALNDLMMNPEASLSDIAGVIADDPAMTAKLLQLVNSAYFGLSHRVSTARQAVSLLGFSTVRNLLMAVELMRSFMVPRGDLTTAVEELQDHSLAVANLARTVMGDSHEAHDAFAAGMLHDIGMLAIIATLPDRFLTLRGEVQAGRPIDDCEQSVLGTSHAHIGAYLLSQWGLPTNLIEAVARSHDAAELPATRLTPTHAVYIAEQIVAMVGSSSIFWEQGDVFDDEYLAGLGIDETVTRILTSARLQ